MLLKYKDHLEANGVEVLGFTDHSIFHSIYFLRSPAATALELACPDPEEEAMLEKLDAGQMGHAGRMVEDQEGAQACGLAARERTQ